MVYLIDASSLIESKNRYYHFDLCPGFWDWLSQQNAAGVIYSIDKIKEELQKGNDDLSKWTRQQGNSFFLPSNDGATIECMRQVSDWVNSSFRPIIVSEFLAGADPFLVAYAMAHKHAIVTDELFIPGQKNKIKIPAVCQQFKVTCINLFDMLRQEGARFVLPSSAGVI